ncbi:unnamed protein product, partial [Ectocarpus sp. 12 AP-2014]
GSHTRTAETYRERGGSYLADRAREGDQPPPPVAYRGAPRHHPSFAYNSSCGIAAGVEFSSIVPALTSTCRAMDSGPHATATEGSTLPSIDPLLAGAKRPRDDGHGGGAAEGIIPESASQHRPPQQRRQQQPAISSSGNGRGHEETGGGRASSSPKRSRGLPAAAKKAPRTPGAAAAAAATLPSPAVESATAAAAGAAKPVPVGETVGDVTSGAEAGSGASASHVAEASVVQKCQVCGEKERRYCCPRCGKLTCSLPCYKRHKKEEGCNGKRDKVAFVGLQDFTDAHLRSDFNFLEDAIRCVDGGRRELARRPGVLGTPSKQQRNAGRGGARG